MSNSNREDVVTLLWEIENFNEFFTHKLESPVFLSNSLDFTGWKVCLYPKGCDGNADYISLSLTRCDYSKPEVHTIVLDCELSINEEYGKSSIVSKQTTKHGFINNHCWSPCKTFVSRDDVFGKRRTKFIPFNILHVRCRMWRSSNKTTVSELLIFHTKVERSHFVWKINNFSCLKANEAKEMHVKQAGSETPILSYKFYTDGFRDAAIVEIASEKRFNIGIWCEIIALDCTGKKFESEWQEFTLNDENPYRFPSFITISCLLDNKALYLPMDVLSLQVDSFFWSSDIKGMNESLITIPNLQVYESFPCTGKNDSQRKAETVLSTQISDTRSIFMPHNLERFVQGIHCMYEEGLLSDFTLCAENRTFPVHKSILSARSPVFKAMFTTPLKEKDGRGLDIPDIDADTLHRMLLFVYSNEVGDLEWEEAINLYFAADKYNIEDLKNITSSALKSELRVSNVCDILVHADLHEDQELKCSAMEFIASHDDEILGSENWKKIQKKHMSLTMEILSVLYTKIKKRIE